MTSIHLRETERHQLLHCYRRSADPEARLRAHILLLLDAGHPWATVSAVLFCSLSTVSRWKRRFEAEGVDAVFGHQRGRQSSSHFWATLVVRWVLTLSPVDFHFARSRWSCEAVAVVLREDFRVAVGRETVRLWLRNAGLVWRRPRPVIRPKDPDRGAKLRALRELLHGLPADETAVFMDEVDVNLNPKVGCMWMRRGEQAVVCDNAGIHTAERSKAVRAYLEEWGERVKVHYLPKYAPDTNPIERVWWRLHEAVTRNHRCQSMDELLDLTFDWFETRTHFRVRSVIYDKSP
jgi:transposase